MALSENRISPDADWNRLRPAAEHALVALLQQVQQDASAQDLLDSYLYAKRLLAESMQAKIRAGLPAVRETFSGLRERLHEIMVERYGDRIDARYLAVPYGSRVHEELFAILLQRLGQPVTAVLLRVVTNDSVHTERRLRELRELGLDIETQQEGGADTYCLRSLEINPGMIPKIIVNNLRDKRAAPADREFALAVLGGSAG
jgi:hypothetical protein